VQEDGHLWLVDADLPAPGRLEIQFQGDVEAFERSDAEHGLKTGVLMFAGSSTFTAWQDVQDYFKPLRTLSRAYGGSSVWEMWHWADRAIIPYRPRVVVVYIGDNDIARLTGMVPGQEWRANPAYVGFFMKYVDKLVTRVRAALPHTQFVFCGVKPSEARWAGWKTLYEPANAALKDYCARGHAMRYVDTTPIMLDETGALRPGLFNEDGLHIKHELYAAWADRIRPAVLSLW
jgi:lysophospholipase L1-like esterase